MSSIAKLTVRFPEDRMSLGDIPAGATTEYEDVPNGVYAYADSLEIDGAMITQPVIDWLAGSFGDGNLRSHGRTPGAVGFVWAAPRTIRRQGTWPSPGGWHAS